MGKAQRNKGAVGEREWCKIVSAHTPKRAKRDLEQTRDKGGDVPAAPYLFEVKRRHGIAVRSFLDQAEDALKTGRYAGCRYPAVAMREDGRTDWMVLMSADTFFDMVAKSRGAGWDLPTMEDLL